MIDIERQILDAMARNTALLQRRAADRARDAFAEYQRQKALIDNHR